MEIVVTALISVGKPSRAPSHRNGIKEMGIKPFSGTGIVTMAWNKGCGSLG
ncbi:MAG: hypothetical protein GX162_11395 [Firmicutes bacterium]|nr:hypothetical protein [Bacillota bacterium]